MKPLQTLSLTALTLSTLACTTTASDQTEQATDNAPTTIEETRAWLQDFQAHYNYDVQYMETLLDLSPAAYEAFAAGMGMSEHRVALSPEAHFIGATSALKADDCGQCTQLNLRMAVEAGVSRELLQQVLSEPGSLPAPLDDVSRYATQVVKGENADAVLVRRLKEALGEEAFAELAVNVVGVRIYPALRRAMGAETVCPPPSLDF